MSAFRIQTFVPLLKEHIQIKELKNADYLDLVKCIDKGDNEIISEAFENLIQEQIVNKDVIGKLTIIGKVVVLLEIYRHFIHETIDFSVTAYENEGTRFSVGIESIIDELNKVDYNLISEHVEISDGVELFFSLPSSLYVKQRDILTDIIYTIFSETNKYYFHTFNREEQILFLDSITTPIIKPASDAIESINEDIGKIKFIKKVENVELEEVECGLFTNEMFFFMKALFSADMYDIYMKQYFMIKILGSDYDHYLKIPPMEVSTMTRLYESDRKEQEKQLQKEQQGVNTYKE